MIEFDGLTDPDCKEIAGIPYSAALINFCDAFMGGDADDLSTARELLASEMSPEAMVDVAGIAANFQRMNRIADATGMPQDSLGHEKASEIRDTLNEKLGINKYDSAVNSICST